jgi:membrane protein implicated in regulation of membrane protease activity
MADAVEVKCNMKMKSKLRGGMIIVSHKVRGKEGRGRCSGAYWQIILCCSGRSHSISENKLLRQYEPIAA